MATREQHNEEFEVMFALLIAGGAIREDAVNDASAWARLVTPFPGMKSTDCAGNCCYNATQDSCEDDDCHCHTYDASNVVAPF